MNYLLLSLLSFFLISKEIFIVNEEAILLVCFFGMVFFLYKNISEGVNSELENRSKKIKDEFSAHSVLKEKKQELILSSYKQIGFFISEVKQIASYINNILTNISNKRALTFEDQLRQRLKSDLDSIIRIENKNMEQVRKLFAEHMNEQVIQIAQQKKVSEKSLNVAFNELDRIKTDLLNIRVSYNKLYDGHSMFYRLFDK